ncbi:MAG: lipid A biosynthesis protein [Nitrospirales bacterium]|nr:MAG: lipid A biosynthesis protein [Nitrospirales bacterium]
MTMIDGLWLAIEAYFSSMTGEQIAWKCVGLLGVLLFFSRWIIQWIASERRAQSHMPLLFWYLSFAGAVMTLAYVLYLGDEILILGNSANSFVYARNLMLIYQGRKQTSHG